jgi:hypothetical protein
MVQYGAIDVTESLHNVLDDSGRPVFLYTRESLQRIVEGSTDAEISIMARKFGCCRGLSS